MYRCDSCGQVSQRWFGICPICHDGQAVEVQEAAGNADGGDQDGFAPSIPSWKGAGLRQSMRYVNPQETADRVVRKLPFPQLNAILSAAGGLVESQVVLLGAAPGVGKSTLCAAIADAGVLYISSEESYHQVNSRMLRVHPDAGCAILNTTSISEILNAIKEWDGDCIILDSLNGVEFGVGYSTVARFANEIVKSVKAAGKVAIIVSHVAKNGEISGMNSIPHAVDTVVHLERGDRKSVV